MEGSTKIIIDSSQGVVNRLDYDTLGNIRNQTAAPQVEMLWRNRQYFSEYNLYIKRSIYFNNLGFGTKIGIKINFNNFMEKTTPLRIEFFYSLIDLIIKYPAINILSEIIMLSCAPDNQPLMDKRCKNAIERAYNCFIEYRSGDDRSSEECVALNSDRHRICSGEFF